ncbi:MAG: NAD(P)/FAD-dependent oxidoreductase [Chitinophagaceae bacterium]|nr:NAD(P)/FAD-dependent oxidoreductase [Chitinophagaceae bacterium]
MVNRITDTGICIQACIIANRYRFSKPIRCAVKKAIIIGAGPAGLTAAYELLTKTDIIPVVIELDKQVGGLSKTIDYNGNKIDIGGHRFFSKSGTVIDWWLNFLPLQPLTGKQDIDLKYHHKTTRYTPASTSQTDTEKVMLVRPRKSSIYYNKKFFDYPLQLNLRTVRNLGLVKMLQIAFSYARSKFFPETPETTLEQFFKNRFGSTLYETFFKEYTEKVWGVPCSKLPATWGQQRVKDLSISKVLKHAVKSVLGNSKGIRQEGTSTSLIEQFLYPMYGPGQMWETVAGEIVKRGGTIQLQTSLQSVVGNNGRITHVTTKNERTGNVAILEGDYFFSSIPVKELVEKTEGLYVPENVMHAAQSLEYRDFLIVGILTSSQRPQDRQISDNWIYLQDKNLKAGRVQFFHNWSPGMIKQQDTNWIGVEYFCNETDDFWQQDDKTISIFAVQEMEEAGLISQQDVKDTLVVKVKKAYPSYFGGYDNFHIVQQYLDSIHNLFPIGRNGMHRYNNTDHSMLTAMVAVNNIIINREDKSNIWEINTENEYHEEAGNTGND